VSIYNGVVYDTGVPYDKVTGLMHLFNVITGDGAIYYLHQSGMAEIADPGTKYTPTADNDNTINVYYSGSPQTIKVQNLSGSTILFHYGFGMALGFLSGS